MQDLPYCYEYPRPAVTTDCIIFGYDISEVYVLLVERANNPYKGRWAFPGGFLDMDETTEECVKREVFEETGLSLSEVKQLLTASKVDRDPRGRVLSVVYTSKVRVEECRVIAGDDAKNAKWFRLSNIPPLAFDHKEILDKAIELLQDE